MTTISDLLRRPIYDLTGGHIDSDDLNGELINDEEVARIHDLVHSPTIGWHRAKVDGAIDSNWSISELICLNCLGRDVFFLIEGHVPENNESDDGDLLFIRKLIELGMSLRRDLSGGKLIFDGRSD